MTAQTRVSPTATARARTVTAVLGPTNTGKTHLAIERMLAHGSGLIGLPLRLLAREVYGRVAQRAGEDAVALITGEEKIVPAAPRYVVSTVEAMPRETDAAFVAIDEVQLAGDLERGRVFTDRILSVRGRFETLLLGATTARPLLEKLLPGLNVVVRPRMSVLTYAGVKKLTRLPPRSAIVAFSADEVYAIAELIRRQRGGAAVVLGSLSPRTRNAQVELFQSGDVEFLVATDAIGMGLNLDVDHVSFAGNRKFDGYQYRLLNPAELGQIAGRAGRHMRDGTFGVTGRAPPFDDEVVEALESHRFQPLKMFQWRNPDLDFASLEALRRSLDEPPREEGLTRAPPAEDVVSLEHAARDPEIRDLAVGRERVARLWDVCQVPDYRKIAPANHADLVLGIYGYIVRAGAIPDDWFARQIAFADRMDGDIDTLANRIAHIRTWTYVANRADWLADPEHWRGITKDIEDRLSDALHERLLARFVDRRTSVLMRRLRENAMLDPEITPEGDVTVEGQHVGRLHGFRFVAVGGGDGPDGKALRAAAAKALAGEIDGRAERLSRAADGDIVLSADGALRWQGEVVAKLTPGDDVLRPGFVLIADETLSGPARDLVQTRLATWLKAQLETQLKPLFDLRGGGDLTGMARGLAFRLSEALGVIERPAVSEDVKGLDQAARASLRSLGVRFGAHHLFVPALLKPGPCRLIAVLWALKNADFEVPGLAEVPQLSASGRTSMPIDPAVPVDLYRVCGYKVCGGRAVRLDILERLADIIRPILAWKPSDGTSPPEGAYPGGGFTVTVRMTSLVGCAGEDFASILKALGFRADKRPAAAPPVPIARPAPAPAPVAAAVEAPVETAVEASASDEVAADASVEVLDAGEPTEAAVDGDAAVAETAEATPEETPAGDEVFAPDEIDGAAAETAEAASEEPVADDALAATDAALAPAEVEMAAEAGEPAVAVADVAVDIAETTEASPPDDSEAEPADATPVEPPEAALAEAAPDATEETAPAEPAEPVLVDVWRPGRADRRRDEGPRHRRHHRAQRGDEAGASERRTDGPRPERGRPDRPAGDRPASDRPEARTEGQPRGDRPDNRAPRRDDRGPRPEGRGPRREDGGQRADNRGPRREDGPPRRDDRGPRREDRGPRRNDGPRHEAPRPERRTTADPLSPFAALAALKADLERRDRER